MRNGGSAISLCVGAAWVQSLYMETFLALIAVGLDTGAEWWIMNAVYQNHFSKFFDSSRSVDSVKSFQKASSTSWLFHSFWSLITDIFCWNRRRLIIVAQWPWSGFLGFQTLYTWVDLSSCELKYVFVSMEEPHSLDPVWKFWCFNTALSFLPPAQSHYAAVALVCRTSKVSFVEQIEARKIASRKVFFGDLHTLSALFRLFCPKTPAVHIYLWYFFCEQEQSKSWA